MVMRYVNAEEIGQVFKFDGPDGLEGTVLVRARCLADAVKMFTEYMFPDYDYDLFSGCIEDPAADWYTGVAVLLTDNPEDVSFDVEGKVEMDARFTEDGLHFHQLEGEFDRPHILISRNHFPVGTVVYEQYWTARVVKNDTIGGHKTGVMFI